jgi:hypothetical protein
MQDELKEHEIMQLIVWIFSSKHLKFASRFYFFFFPPLQFDSFHQFCFREDIMIHPAHYFQFGSVQNGSTGLKKALGRQQIMVVLD